MWKRHSIFYRHRQIHPMEFCSDNTEFKTYQQWERQSGKNKLFIQSIEGGFNEANQNTPSTKLRMEVNLLIAAQKPNCKIKYTECLHFSYCCVELASRFYTTWIFYIIMSNIKRFNIWFKESCRIRRGLSCKYNCQYVEIVGWIQADFYSHFLLNNLRNVLVARKKTHKHTHTYTKNIYMHIDM